jgi:PAS domain S-box-containing protein
MSIDATDKDELPAAIIESTSDGVLSRALDGTISSWNRGMTHLLGYTESEMVGQSINRLIPPDRRDEERALRARIAKGERIEHFETVRVCKNGLAIDVSMTMSPLRDGAGAIIGASAILRDVSERRAADEARALLAAIIESSEDGIVSHTLGGVITSWNAAAARIYGHDAIEMVGRPTTALIPSERRAEQDAIFERVRQGEPISHFETVRLGADGRRIDVSVSMAPVLDASRTIVGTSEIVRDITDQKRIEAALVRAKEETDAANQDLESFSYSVAHDLRTPLRSIDGFSRALLEDQQARLDAEGLQHLRAIRESTERMNRLIDDLILLSRVDRGEVARARVDLTALARGSLERLAAVDPLRAVDLVLAPGVVTLGDAGLLAIVLENLLANAWKFTRTQPRARIEFGQTEKDGRPVYFVRDNGVGFEATPGRTLFGVFQRFHAAAEFEGTGIGLAIVKRVIRRHGGAVWAQSKPGHGATFFFTTAPAKR